MDLIKRIEKLLHKKGVKKAVSPQSVIFVPILPAQLAKIEADERSKAIAQQKREAAAAAAAAKEAQ